ncbi:hypothetical protein [Rhodococcus jostii]|uniref:Uncharacterized protein n=1 Tax=Rhodococcus jostii TaxID=132919 RepID=A0A1H5H438_RHOJO|nr:hypothetical protein [Rhodococcus jostii]SEE22690.1 hypothetical protein SAMN04490220_7063 [Rhodococcus jostii]
MLPYLQARAQSDLRIVVAAAQPDLVPHGSHLTLMGCGFRTLYDASLATLPGVQRLSSTLVMKSVADNRPLPLCRIEGRCAHLGSFVRFDSLPAQLPDQLMGFSCEAELAVVEVVEHVSQPKVILPWSQSEVDQYFPGCSPAERLPFRSECDEFR